MHFKRFFLKIELIRSNWFNLLNNRFFGPIYELKSFTHDLDLIRLCTSKICHDQCTIAASERNTLPYYLFFYMTVRSVLIIHYISSLLLNLMERIFEWAILFVSRWPARRFLALMVQLNALLSLPQQVSGRIWKISKPFLEKLSSGLNKPIKLFHFVENASDFE